MTGRSTHPAWPAPGAQITVRSPYSGEPVATVDRSGPDDARRAVGRAVVAAEAMRRLPSHERRSALHAAADLIERDWADLSAIITAEQGKTRFDADAEASRIAGIVRLCAEEAVRLTGEVLPMDAAVVSAGRLGYTRPEPCGVTVAITPFNYPAILVMHKVGPALAAGNAVILKPAEATPLTAAFLTERLTTTGLPEDALQCLVGSGPELGPVLCGDSRVRRVSFTGSFEVGQAIARSAGAKRLTCELGSNAAFVVLDDADVERAARAIAFSGFTNAGQNCVSTQRVVADTRVRDELVERLLEAVDALVTGDPAAPATTLAPLIDSSAADRVVTWLREASAAGGDLVRGGGRTDAIVDPAVVLDPPPSTRVWREELFGPAVVLRTADGEGEALALANDTRFGLAASVATGSLDRGLRFAHGVRAGMVNVNPPRGSTWRADFMPWGGVGDSGFGREGVRYAVRDMCEERFVVVHPEDSA